MREYWTAVVVLQDPQHFAQSFAML